MPSKTFLKNCFIAVYAIEEPFYIAQCLQTIAVKDGTSEDKFKIKWLDKTGSKKNGSDVYSLSHEDNIYHKNIITSISIKKISRFRFLLDAAEVAKILAFIPTSSDHTPTPTPSTSNEDVQETNLDDKTHASSRPKVIHEGQEETVFPRTQDETSINFYDIENETDSLSRGRPIIETSTQLNDLRREVASVFTELKNVYGTITTTTAAATTTTPPKAKVSTDEEGSEEERSVVIDVQENLVRRYTAEEVENFHDYSSSGTDEFIPPSSESSEDDEHVASLHPRGFINSKSKKQRTEHREQGTANGEQRTEDGEQGTANAEQGTANEEQKTGNGERGTENRDQRTDSRDLRRARKKETDDEEVLVTRSKRKADGRRVYDKRHNCFFCHKLVNKLTRHLENMHKDEEEVAKLLALRKNDKKRKDGFLCILRAGDYFHNREVLAVMQGELILSRRPPNIFQVSYKKYGPCPNCLGFFLLSTLWHHVKSGCPKRNADPQSSSTSCGKVSRRDIRGESLALLGNSSGEFTTDYMKTIIAALRDDEVSDICKNDTTIMKFGLLLFEKYHSHQNEYIRQTLRQLGRLLKAIAQIKSKLTLQETLMPKNFDHLIAAVKYLCLQQRSEIGEQEYGVPSLALKLGHSLRKCALVVRSSALKSGNLQLDREMESFLSLMEIEWNTRVSASAVRTLRQRKMNTTELLPITDDLLMLNKFLETIISELTRHDNLDAKHWAKLAAATLCRVILFNKRRSGEASRMTVAQYASRPNWQEQCTQEMKASLTPIETTLADRLTVVEVIGKSRALTKVPILLSVDTKNAIDKLIATRSWAEISDKNFYIFARGGGSLNYLRGHDCLRKYCSQLPLQKPQIITSTKLRKYVATVVQLFDLKEQEYDWLARHLGHDIRVHREFYRLHESAIELTKVSRILLAIDQGQASQFKGKSLEDINIMDLPNIGDDGDSSGSDHNGEGEEECSDTIEGAIDTDATDNRVNTLEDTRTVISIDKKGENTRKSRSVERKNKMVKKPWGKEEKKAVLQFFHLNIKSVKVPTKSQAEECIKKNEKLLTHRTWREIKYCVYNQIQMVKKKKTEHPKE